MKALAVRLFLVLCCGGILSLAAANQARATIHEVQVGNFFFSPEKTTVAYVDTVRWIHVSGSHTTTAEVSSPRQWDSGILPSGGSFDVVFTEADGPGPFPHLCTIHPTTMKDTIFVAPAAEPTVIDFVLRSSWTNDCAGNGSPAWGTGQAVLSADSTELTVTVVHNVGDAILGHIHLAPECVNGPIAFGFDSPLSPVEQTFPMTSGFVEALFDEELHVLIHSTEHPAGEIRGHIKPSQFVCGDANGDEAINVGDAVFVINYAFKGGAAPNPLFTGDANCDASVNVGDAVYLINFAFKGGPAPCGTCADL